jgi:hypothetical protein
VTPHHLGVRELESLVGVSKYNPFPLPTDRSAVGTV